MSTKPAFFISSTIYDFKDMRSSIKWWLEENQYRVNASEYNDFDKPLDENSYESCLRAIDNSDYFILLIGDRFGGMYNSDISITQMEYRYAYQRMLEGKIKLINFARQDTLIRVDEYKEHINNNQIDFASLDKPSKEKHRIFLFIQDVRRVEDMKARINPKGNWLHQFNGFSDVLNVLSTELGDKVGLNYKSKRFIIAQLLIDNLMLLMAERQEYGVMPKGFISNKLFGDFKLDLDVSTIQLTKAQQGNLGIFYLSFWQSNEMKVARIDDYYGDGFFLEYDKNANDYVSRDLNELASSVLRNYRAYNALHSTLYSNAKEVIAQLSKKANGDLPVVNTVLVFNAIRLYDVIQNCIASSKSLYRHLFHMNYVLPKLQQNLDIYPEGSLADESEILTEQQVIEFLKS